MVASLKVLSVSGIPKYKEKALTNINSYNSNEDFSKIYKEWRINFESTNKYSIVRTWTLELTRTQTCQISQIIVVMMLNKVWFGLSTAVI
jgi:hypothetical protein